MYQERTIKRLCAECGREFDSRIRTNSRFHDRVCALASMRRDLALAPEIRFWMKVDKNGPVPVSRPYLGPCWLWTAGLADNGYGKFALTSRTTLGAHRYSYELAHGPGSAADLFACHHCDVKACVNPDHLFLGTNSDNILDAVSKGRAAVGDRNGARVRPERLLRGEAHYEGRLTDERVREIRRRSLSGESRAALGAEFRVSAVMISKVVRWKSWRHVTS